MNQGIHRAGRGLPITDHQVMAMSSVAHIRALIVRKESIKKSGIPSKNHLRLSRKGAGVCPDGVQSANACAFGYGSNETSLPPARRINKTRIRSLVLANAATTRCRFNFVAVPKAGS